MIEWLVWRKCMLGWYCPCMLYSIFYSSAPSIEDKSSWNSLWVNANKLTSRIFVYIIWNYCHTPHRYIWNLPFMFVNISSPTYPFTKQQQQTNTIFIFWSPTTVGPITLFYNQMIKTSFNVYLQFVQKSHLWSAGCMCCVHYTLYIYALSLDLSVKTHSQAGN